jgi:hypothetical protein
MVRGYIWSIAMVEYCPFLFGKREEDKGALEGIGVGKECSSRVTNEVVMGVSRSCW